MSAAHTAKFKVGDRVQLYSGSNIHTVVVAEPDINGNIVLKADIGDYFLRPEDDHELVPQRYTVELRAPKKGERYLFGRQVYTSDADYPDAVAVIVEDPS